MEVAHGVERDEREGGGSSVGWPANGLGIPALPV